MTKNQPPREVKQPATLGKDKKPYQKPSFRHERVFETLALSCGKIGSSTPQCQNSRKTS
ncbi:MAG: hypothetical protein LAO56_18130 [Acidobacteriia bacterium]|jgi:hypothetical protein|nr:hypothetical protein [Terriglobia bacterium]